MLSKLSYSAFLDKELYCSNHKIMVPRVLTCISHVKYAIKVQKGTETPLQYDLLNIQKTHIVAGKSFPCSLSFLKVQFPQLEQAAYF